MHPACRSRGRPPPSSQSTSWARPGYALDSCSESALLVHIPYKGVVLPVHAERVPIGGLVHAGGEQERVEPGAPAQFVEQEGPQTVEVVIQVVDKQGPRRGLQTAGNNPLDTNAKMVL